MSLTTAACIVVSVRRHARQQLLLLVENTQLSRSLHKAGSICQAPASASCSCFTVPLIPVSAGYQVSHQRWCPQQKAVYHEHHFLPAGTVIICVELTFCRLQPVLRGSVMRRSCRLSTKHEHRLLKKAEADAADAAAAEAAEEGVSVYPSTVTKAIAGLTTPSLPSPSMFPEDWRMVEELLHDTQVPLLSLLHCCHRYSPCFAMYCTHSRQMSSNSVPCT